MAARSVRALAIVVWLGAALSGAALSGAAAAEHDPDLCLEVAADVVDADAWDRLVAATEVSIAARPALFPAPELTFGPDADASTRRLTIAAGHTEPVVDAIPETCLAEPHAWGARFSRAFLDAGADRMLAEAPTTPGIGSQVDITWLPLEGRLTTTLTFAGPLDIPNGTCWIDEILSVDAATGQVRVESERGVQTSPFAESACGRFFDHLPDGGAGGQAVSLLPMEVETDTGVLRLRTSEVIVTEDGIVIGGSIEGR